MFDYTRINDYEMMHLLLKQYGASDILQIGEYWMENIYISQKIFAEEQVSFFYIILNKLKIGDENE